MSVIRTLCCSNNNSVLMRWKVVQWNKNKLIFFGTCTDFLNCRHKTRLHIGQLVKDTSAKLKQASETDHRVEVSVSFKKWSPYFSVFVLVGLRFDMYVQNINSSPLFANYPYFKHLLALCVFLALLLSDFSLLLITVNLFFCCTQASKKITDAKLAKDFQAVLKEFQKAQRLAAERETAYTPFVPQAVQPSM